LSAETATGEPEVEAGIDQRYHLVLVEYPTRIGRRGLPGDIGLGGPPSAGVSCDLLEDLCTEGGHRRLGVRTRLRTVIDLEFTARLV
jgi:hypothetical protein